MTRWTASVKHIEKGSVLSVAEIARTRRHIKSKFKYLLFFPLALSAFVCFTRIASPQDSPPLRNTPGGNYTIRMNTNLVVLNATVIDHHNMPVSALTKDDFQVYENHILQHIEDFSHEDVPVAVGLVIDNSTSMGQKRADVIAAALSFAQSSNPRDQMFVVNFNEHVSFGLPPKILFTDRPDQLRLALSSIKTVGETALYDAIATALDHLKQSTCDKRVLVLISDGGDNVSAHSLAQVIEMAKHSTAIIYTIGIFDELDGDQNPGLLRRFAKETGGEAYFPESSKETISICDRIAHDIRNQYTLAYVPTVSNKDTEYRVVDVRASAPGHGRLSVRTRTGYFLPSTSSPESGTIGNDSHK